MTGPLVAPDSPGGVLQLIRSGAATSRSAVAKILGVSASTAASRIEPLIERGYVREAGDGPSLGGRRPRRLELRPDSGTVAAVDLGGGHASVAVFDMCGELCAEETVKIRVSDGPDEVLPTAAATISRLGTDLPPLRGVTVGVPGPVNTRTGQVVSPSRMPGWHGLNVPDHMGGHLPGLPVLVDNDANLMALGEHSANPSDHLVFVKAGTGIGCGVIASGRLHRGAVGAAGDISHLPVAGHEDVQCSCGRTGCLEAVASGAALVRDLRAAGAAVESPADVVALAEDADASAMRDLRAAGRATGEILAPVVNFFNPDVLVVGGQLGRATPFVASVKSALFERCLPMATEDLQVTTARTGRSAGVRGGGHLMLEHLLSPERVNAELG